MELFKWGNAAGIHPNEENSVYGIELSNILINM